MYLHYSDDGDIEYAVKEWLEIQDDFGLDAGNYRQVKKRLIWFDDRIERWENQLNSGSPDGWQHYSEMDDESWPQPWLDETGQPLGIPYIHLPDVFKSIKEYGRSELDGGVIGSQDFLNSAQISIAINVKMTAFQQHWASGVKRTVKRDGSNEFEPIKVAPGMFHTSPNEKSQFGTLQREILRVKLMAMLLS